MNPKLLSPSLHLYWDHGDSPAVRVRQEGALDGAPAVPHGGGVLSALSPGGRRQPRPLSGRGARGARPGGPRGIFTGGLGAQEGKANARRTRGRRRGSTPDPRTRGPVPTPRCVDLRRSPGRSATSRETRPRDTARRRPFSQSVPAGPRLGQRSHHRPEDVYGPRLLGPLPPERPVQVQSATVREAHVSHLPAPVRETAATLAVPSERVEALRLPRRDDRAERVPGSNDPAVPSRSRRPHPEFRPRSESLRAVEPPGRLLPLRRPPRILQGHPGTREGGDDVPGPESIRRRRERQASGCPRRSPAAIRAARPPRMVAGGGARFDIRPGTGPPPPIDLVRECTARRLRGPRVGDAPPVFGYWGVARAPPWRRLRPDDSTHSGGNPPRHRTVRGRGRSEPAARVRPNGIRDLPLAVEVLRTVPPAHRRDVGSERDAAFERSRRFPRDPGGADRQPDGSGGESSRRARPLADVTGPHRATSLRGRENQLAGCIRTRSDALAIA